MRRRSNTIFAEDYESFINGCLEKDNLKEADLNSRKKKGKSKSSLKVKETFLEEYENCGLNHNKEFEFEFIIPSLEDKISTDESDLYENINKINDKIKHEREICLKLLTDINENKEIDIERIFNDLSATLSIDKSKIASGEDLKKFICENFELSEKHLKFLFVGNKSIGKTSVLNYIKNLYQFDIQHCYYDCSPTTSLDISKVYVPVENHLLRIELWDSNLTIQNSKIFETYLKLCNAYIFVYRKNDLETFELLENFLKKFKQFSRNSDNKKVLVICNDLIKEENFSIQNSNGPDISYSNNFKCELIEVQEKSIQALKRQFPFTHCCLSDIDKSFLQQFLLDYI